MEYRHLGRTGLKVSLLSYGTAVSFHNQVDVNKAKSLLKLCYAGGINFFDTAETYADGKAEEILGQAVKELECKRSDLVISTKLFYGGSGPNDKGLSRKHLIEGTKASLRRLEMDYVDLIYCHRPDAATPVEETVRAMNWLIDQGLAFYWGTSEWTAQQITEAWVYASKLDLIGPAMEQPEYNLFERQKVESDYVPLYSAYGTGLTTWSPLCSGVLSGKHLDGNAPEGSRLGLDKYKDWGTKFLAKERLSKVTALRPVAERLSCTLAQLSLAWCARNPNVSSVITGASRQSQVEDNLKALDVMPKLTQDVLDEIDTIFGSKPTAPTTY